jgi:hydroxymethylglutaryl-CoA synthase
LADLAVARGIAAERFTTALGQELMAVPPPGEDIVTLGANAAADALAAAAPGGIDMLLFATESAVDQAKAAWMFVHGLLDLPTRCRVLELKQACYAAAGGLQLAASWLREHPALRVLVIASDIARYGLRSAGEPTQGAGAVAMVVSARPRLLELDAVSGWYAEDVMDFWRPNYRDEALVDGKASVLIYNRALRGAWQHYREQSGRVLTDFHRFCYHMPFTRMAELAHERLFKAEGLAAAYRPEQVAASLAYNRRVGNCYTASVFLGFRALLDHGSESLDGQRVALFSFGSGCVAEFFSGVVPAGYREALDAGGPARLDRRERVDVARYEELYRFHLPEDGSDYVVPAGYDTGPFRLKSVRGHRRSYAKVGLAG